MDNNAPYVKPPSTTVNFWTSPSSFGRVAGSLLTRLHLHPCFYPLFAAPSMKFQRLCTEMFTAFPSFSSQNVQLAQRGRRWHGPSVIQYGQTGHTKHGQKHSLKSTSPPATPQRGRIGQSLTPAPQIGVSEKGGLTTKL